MQKLACFTALICGGLMLGMAASNLIWERGDVLITIFGGACVLFSGLTIGRSLKT